MYPYRKQVVFKANKLESFRHATRAEKMQSSRLLAQISAIN